MDIVNVMAIITSVGLLIFVVELIRQGLLKERYSLLWLLSGVVLLVLSSSRNVLEFISHFVGIYYPPSFLFLVAFLFLLVITLHFTVVISGLSEKNKRLAQELALLRLMVEEHTSMSGNKQGTMPDSRAKSS